MLDFYIIKDKQTTPNYPEQASLEFISGLNLKSFKNLQKKGIIDSQFNYYSDFRWNNLLTKQINMKISKIKVQDSDMKKLISILEKAIEAESGIIAYCD